MNISDIKIDLKKCTMFLLVPPIIVFFAFWINLLVAVLSSVMLIIASVFALRIKDNNCIITIKVSNLILVFFVAFIWCWLGGIGGLFYQYYDHDWRNAIFHDLINKSWPLVYNTTQKYLCYYITSWLIPSLFGKFSILLGASQEAAWYFANIVLLIYCAFVVTLVFLCIFKHLNVIDIKQIGLVSLIFIFFSGMDFLGIILSGYDPFKIMVYEGWTGGLFEYQSMFTGLSWSYNQHEFAWLITAIMLLDKNNKRLAFWGMLLFAYAPFPLVSTVIFAIIMFLQNLYKNKNNIKNQILNVFSFENILSILSVGLVFSFYYSSNISLIKTNYSSPYMVNDKHTLKLYLIFLAVEVLPFIIIVFKENRKNILYFISSLILIAFPLFRIGKSMDFGMKATIPALFYIFILIADKVLKINTKQIKANKITVFLIAGVLFVGALTPINEINTGINSVIAERRLNIQCDTIRSFENPFINSENFTSDINTPFQKYLMKEN